MAMKLSLLPLLVSTALLAGCGKDSTASQAAKNANEVASAPGNYLKTITDAEKSSEQKIDVAALNKVVQQFNVQEGRNPKDLNELVTMRYLGKVPEPPNGYKITYDATSGQVNVVKQ